MRLPDLLERYVSFFTLAGVMDAYATRNSRRVRFDTSEWGGAADLG